VIALVVRRGKEHHGGVSINGCEGYHIRRIGPHDFHAHARVIVGSQIESHLVLILLFLVIYSIIKPRAPPRAHNNVPMRIEYFCTRGVNVMQ
jgi:hypothetical protein